LIFKIFLIILPLILFVFLTNYDAFAQETDLQCPEGKVAVVRITNPNPICVTETTAQRWAQMKIIHVEVADTTITDFQYTSITDDLSRAQSYLITLSNGEFTEPITFQTFSQVEPGGKSKYIPSFYDLGLVTNFSLESIPSTDKIEFYKLIARTINPGKHPELFDVSVDVLAGDNSVIVTVNYPKCRITDYTPYSQDFVLFYQFSESLSGEIRDKAVLYCSGFNIQVYDDKNQKIIPTELLPFTPSADDSIQGYVVHFFGPNFDGLYTVETFSEFSASSAFIETPFDVITTPGNPFDAKPQFFLESLPSKDKEELYKYFARWVNPGEPPQFVNVSVDTITGNGTILQRWNYIDCSLYDYNMRLEDSILRFSLTGEKSAEIRDRSEFTCNGRNLEIGGDNPLPKFPIRAYNIPDEELISPTLPEPTERAQTFSITAFGGELTETHYTDDLQKFDSIRRDRGPLTPANQAKIYDFGFKLESLPEKEKTPFYKFISRYINPGKTPEPFDVNIDTITGDGTTLHRFQYTNCAGVDFWWYLQDATWFYQFSQKQQDEIRERYIFYCDGFGIYFP